MQTCVYLRVSTTDQKTDSQKAEALDWLRRQGLSETNVKWYVDQETGRSLSRPALARLRCDVDAGLVQTIIVQRLDRLSRRMLDGLNLIAHWANRGVRIVAFRQQIDITGPLGMMLAAVLLGFAENENEVRSERQRAGISIARLAGKYKGRKKGATKASPGQAVRLHERGLTIREIAKALGISRSTVRSYLKDYRCSNSSPLPVPTTPRPVDGAPSVCAFTTDCISYT